MIKKLCWILAITWGCSQNETALFSRLSADQIGIDFVNYIDNSDSMNILNYIYYYDGGGVGAGDFNNDGMTDLFFTGNKVDDQLFLNKGNWQFENVTKQANVSSNGWSTGVTIVDINSDGWLDIYVCRAGGFADSTQRTNVLYVNSQDGTFTEQATKYGIADVSNSTHPSILVVVHGPHHGFLPGI